MPHSKPYTPHPLARVAALYINRERVPTPITDLQALFCEADDARPMAASLFRLARRGDLSRRDIDRVPHYAPAGFDWGGWERRIAAGRNPWIGPVAQPRRVDVMHAPVYVPPPTLMAAVRPGANDFLRCKTAGIERPASQTHSPRG